MGYAAGVAKVNITPPIGCWLDGYGGRTHGAEGVRDELCARALYLSDGQSDVFLISVEVVGLRRESVARIQAQIAAETGISADRVLISATHTHSGPATGLNAQDHPLTGRSRATLEDKVAGAAIWAHAQAAPARLVRLYGEVLCGVNRRERRDGRIVLGINPDGPVDPSVDILHVTDPDGKTLAVWFAHACHPVVMGTSNYLISGDFAGAAARFVEAATGGVALFANGATGDINARPHNGIFADVDRLGARLGSEVVQALTKTPEAAGMPAHIVVAHAAPLLPTEPLPSSAAAQAALAEARAELEASQADGNANKLFWARRKLRHAEALVQLLESEDPQAGVRLPLTIAGIGDLALVGAPCEVFVELGLAVRAGSPFARTAVLGYTNGYMGYLPTAAAFAEGGYEIGARIVHNGLAIAPAAGEAFAAASLATLREAAAGR